MFIQNILSFSAILLSLIGGLSLSSRLEAQSLQHPHIWVNSSDKQAILDNIANYEWAESLFTQYKNRVDGKVTTHKTNPSAILNTISDIPGVSADRTPHTDMLTSASEAAILYYLTSNEDYAQYAADILSHYNQRYIIYFENTSHKIVLL